MREEQIGVIGGGNMGTAIIAGIRDHFKVSVSEKEKKKSTFLRRIHKVKTATFEIVVSEADVIIIAVKPQDIDGVLAKLSKLVNKDKLVISIAAGITTSYIEKQIGRNVRVIRVMPNLPSQVLKGYTAIAKGKYAKTADLKLATDLFKYIGEAQVVKENLIDAITAVSGSGPAYFFLFVEMLISAAQALGLDKKMANAAVLQTVIGSAALLDRNRKLDPAKQRHKVTSKGGTTEAAIQFLMSKKVDKIFEDALKEAKGRAKQLSKS